MDLALTVSLHNGQYTHDNMCNGIRNGSADPMHGYNTFWTFIYFQLDIIIIFLSLIIPLVKLAYGTRGTGYFLYYVLY